MIDRFKSRPYSNKKPLNLSKVDAMDRFEILKLAASKELKQKDISEMFNIRTSSVSKLVSDFRCSGSTILKRQKREINSQYKDKIISEIVTRLIASSKSIWSAKQIKQAVYQQYGLKVSIKQVIKVLKQSFKMTSRKVRRIPYPGNFEQNKVLRCLYAKTMLKLYDSDTRVINIDETTIISSQYFQRRWKCKGMINTTSDKTFSQKLNVI